MAKPLTVFKCASPGMVGAQPYVEETDEGFEVRQAVCLFGSFNMKEEDLERIKYNPFHDDFHDNFVSGKGNTLDEAVLACDKDYEEMYKSLWD